ncbi:MAG: PilZ domain-containing protein [Desulfobulbus sp.]|nr:PilZ domain-containing protein [Desulfobulbus sp.]
MHEILEKLNNNVPAVVELPGINGNTIRCRALFVKKDSPCLDLVFPPQAWDAADLQIGADCTLAVEHSNMTVNLLARLDRVVNDRRLSLTARARVVPELMREYFRVAINTPIKAAYIARPDEPETNTWELAGTTLDLSGSGVLAFFSVLPPSRRDIQLTITVPEEDHAIACLADIVRSYKIRDNRFHIAFHFEDIAAKTRDMIMACCMHEQRRQRREQVHTT